MLKFLIPDVPPSLNRTLRLHWTAKKKLKDKWILEIRGQHLPAKDKPLKKMCATITLYHSRFYDRDNAYGAVKVVVDALRYWNILRDDTDEWLDLKVFQGKCPHKERHTVIVVS